MFFNGSAEDGLSSIFVLQNTMAAMDHMAHCCNFVLSFDFKTKVS